MLFYDDCLSSKAPAGFFGGFFFVDKETVIVSKSNISARVPASQAGTSSRRKAETIARFETEVVIFSGH